VKKWTTTPKELLYLTGFMAICLLGFFWAVGVLFSSPPPNY
jgi:hypothetical protein